MGNISTIKEVRSFFEKEYKDIVLKMEKYDIKISDLQDATGLMRHELCEALESVDKFMQVEEEVFIKIVNAVKEKTPIQTFFDGRFFNIPRTAKEQVVALLEEVAIKSR